jgi:hypothetical protein
VAHLFLALVALTGCARAGTLLTATDVDWNRGKSIWINEDGTSQDAYFAGVILITLSQEGNQYYRDTLCVDLFTDISVGVTYGSQILHPYQVPGRNLDRVSWLVDNALMPAQGPIYTSALSSSDWVTSAAQGAGIQLAIWDITTDGGDGLSAGRVQASTNTGQETDATVLYWAQRYELLSTGQQSDLAFVYRNWDLGTGAPAQMLEGPLFRDSGPVPNPEPVTYAIVGAALVALGLLGRRPKSHAGSDPE